MKGEKISNKIKSYRTGPAPTEEGRKFSAERLFLEANSRVRKNANSKREQQINKRRETEKQENYFGATF